jgi:transposase-like protein
MSIPRVSVPNCPECGSDETAIAYDKLGTTTYCCDECGGSWRVERQSIEQHGTLAPRQPAAGRKGPLKRT